MTEPTSIATTPARLSLGEASEAYEAAVDPGARRGLGDAAVRSRRDASGPPIRRVQAEIAERLGWLDAPAHFSDRTAALEGFGDAVVDEGFTTVVVAGMGGSSLAPDVLHRTFGTPGGLPGPAHPRLDRSGRRRRDARRPRPAADARRSSPASPARRPSRTRSWPSLGARARGARRRRAPLRTRDPAGSSRPSPIPARASRRSPTTTSFREVFLNPPDIGGRYSALTYVGLVPASLIGLDLDALLASASRCSARAASRTPAVNPGAVARARHRRRSPKAGRDKLTFLADADDRELRRVGGAAHRREHRQARRRDRAGRPRAARAGGCYGTDRAFVRIALAGCDRRRSRRARRRARGGRPSGHPDRRSPTRSTSAPSSSAGRSRPRSRGRCSASIRSTSRTSRRPSS